MSTSRGRVQLADTPTGPGRSTASLLASLQARLAALHLCSGADAVASIASGLAELGREASKTADGARLRAALEKGRTGTNGKDIWTRMRFKQWSAGVYPTPILCQLRNDLALLLADDVSETLNALPIPGEMVGFEAMKDLPDVEFLDVVIGLWAFSHELIRSIESIAASTLPPSCSFTSDKTTTADVDGSLLI